MGWETSDRRSRLPANWPKLRREQLARDGHRCTAILPDGTRCPAVTGLEVDHIEAKTDDHSRLQSLCAGHHKAKTSREGHLAYMAKRREQRKRIEREFGNVEEHPGALRGSPHKQPWEVA